MMTVIATVMTTVPVYMAVHCQNDGYAKKKKSANAKVSSSAEVVAALPLRMISSYSRKSDSVGWWNQEQIGEGSARACERQPVEAHPCARAAI